MWIQAFFFEFNYLSHKNDVSSQHFRKTYFSNLGLEFSNCLHGRRKKFFNLQRTTQKSKNYTNIFLHNSNSLKTSVKQHHRNFHCNPNNQISHKCSKRKIISKKFAKQETQKSHSSKNAVKSLSNRSQPHNRRRRR